MLGLETAFGVVNTALVESGVLTPLEAIARLTTGPAGVRDVAGHGGAITAGAPANLTVLDPAQTWTVEGRALHSRARNTPYQGRELTGRAVHTLLRGRFTLHDGQVVHDQPGPQDDTGARTSGAATMGAETTTEVHA